MKRIWKNIDGSFLLTEDVVGLYPRIQHTKGILALKTNKRTNFLRIPINDLDTLAEFVLKNKYSEFNNDVKQRISGTVIGTMFAPPYACIYRDKYLYFFI